MHRWILPKPKVDRNSRLCIGTSNWTFGNLGTKSSTDGKCNGLTQNAFALQVSTQIGYRVIVIINRRVGEVGGI